ncbi:hypothetical protein [uncultured Tateyamaria sp.]|uniref:hypothetical protein n=1 Tax=uncultured Tateyamaria sp. TaxID=455651 RepID=UPI00263885B3|nr:hypothetical protein [uncultured Tateyamaria sp.]
MSAEIFISLVLSLTLSGAALACEVQFQTPAEKRQINRDARANSKPVEMGRYCSFVNGGLYDQVSGGDAQPLDKSRVYHVLDTAEGVASDLMVVDCDALAVTRVIAGYIDNDNYSIDSCGHELGDREPIIAPAGPLTLTEGDGLAAFEQIAMQTRKVWVDGDLAALRLDLEGGPVPRKDRVDFLCGCRLHHPQSKGALQ